MPSSSLTVAARSSACVLRVVTKMTGMSKTACLTDAKRLIVSEQSLGRVNLELYKGGVVIMDEVRSLASIPGGKTLERPEYEIQSVLRILCTNAAYRVAMDADVSADGAVRDWLRVVAPHFDVLHVQLRQAALHRELHYGYTSCKRDVTVMQMRQRLALHRARQSRLDATAGETGQRLRASALKVIGSLLRPARRSGEEPSAADRLELPRRRAAGDARDAPVDWKPVSVGLLRREPERGYGIGYDRLAMACFWLAKSDFSRQIERVHVICASQKQATTVADQADTIGARPALDEGVYKGKGANDQVKRAHFKDTSRPWLWADVVIATSTLSVGVNVRVHFACCFLYTMATAHAGKLRELFQGIVRVGRDTDDPLRDERIFTLIAGSPPSLETDPTPQPERHAKQLAERRRKATSGAEAAAHAKREADKRVGIEGQEFSAEESTLDDAMLSLLAWNDLEAEDNAGGRHVFKMMELCKLPPRAWEPKLMADPSSAEKVALDAFERDLKLRGESTRPLTADAAVSGMSTADQYVWLCGELQSDAAADGKPLTWHRAQFLTDQETLLTKSRPEHDARGSVRAEIYQVLIVLHANSFLGLDVTEWPADGKAFAKLSHTVGQLKMRAMLIHVPPAELKLVHELLRRDKPFETGHYAVVTPAHEMHGLLTEFAEVLRVPFTSLLMGFTFSPTCTAAADGLQSGQCHATACDGSCHEWLRLNNRLRAKIGSAQQQQQDEARRKRLLELAKRLGATQPDGRPLHGASMPVKIVGTVLVSVLALTPPDAPKDCGPGETKTTVAAASKRCFQVAEPWVVADEHAATIGAIQLPMLHPETKQLLRVRADGWEAKFQHLTSGLPPPDPYAALLSDSEEEEDGDVEMGETGDGTAALSGGVQRAGFDRLRKAFQVDTTRLAGVIETLEGESPAIAAAIDGIDARLDELRDASQGAAGGAKSVAVLLVHPDEPKVLLALEPRPGGVGLLSPLGGKLDAHRGDGNLRGAAARLAREQTQSELSKAAKRSLLSGNGVLGAYDAASRAFVYAHRLANGQDIFLPSNVTTLNWVPLDDVLSEQWCRQHCHAVCQSHLAAARPLLQALWSQGGAGAAAGPSGAAAADIGAMAREMRELEAMRKALTRHQGFLAVAQGMKARCDGKPVGCVTLHDEYAHHGVGGRRWVESHSMTTAEAGLWQQRSATLQGGHSDLRALCCGQKAHDIDCENGDYRLIASGAAQIGRAHLVPSVVDYIEHRDEHLSEICALHSCSQAVAKRMPNVVGNGGTYYTWLRNNELEPALLSAFNGKRCKRFLPEDKCRAGEPNMARELRALRDVVFEQPRYEAQVAAKREQLERRDSGPQSRHAISLWSNIVQTWEDEVLGIIDETLFALGWDVWALVFDGVMAAPSAACTEPDIKKALEKAQTACEQRGWQIVLAEKPLYGLQDEMPKTVVKAREALESWGTRQAFAASD